jgi:hypothetical protein
MARQNRYRRREVNTGRPFCLNFALPSNGWEARAWDKQCRENFSGGRRSGGNIRELAGLGYAVNGLHPVAKSAAVNFESSP